MPVVISLLLTSKYVPTGQCSLYNPFASSGEDDRGFLALWGFYVAVVVDACTFGNTGNMLSFRHTECHCSDHTDRWLGRGF